MSHAHTHRTAASGACPREAPAHTPPRGCGLTLHCDVLQTLRPLGASTSATSSCNERQHTKHCIQVLQVCILHGRLSAAPSAPSQQCGLQQGRSSVHRTMHPRCPCCISQHCVSAADGSGAGAAAAAVALCCRRANPDGHWGANYAF